jgi:hypothetical protein
MTRLPGEAVVDAYLDRLQRQADAAAGTVLVAHSEGVLVGFVVGWIEAAEIITETPDSNRFGYISDICLAALLLRAIEQTPAQRRRRASPSWN